MHTRPIPICLCFVALQMGVSASWGDVDVTIIPSTQHQTILGWGATISPIDIPTALRDQVMDEATRDLGLTRLRTGLPAGNKSDSRRWEWLNDNGDPFDMDLAMLNTAAMAPRVTGWILPFKQRVEARGEPFCLYVSPSFFDGGSSGTVPSWMINSPAEYAEFALSVLTYLRDQHGIMPDFYCILNEPGNNNPFSEQVVGQMIRTLGPRLQPAGLSTMIEFPECVSPNRSWHYIQSLQGDEDIWPYVGLLSYHLYGSRGDRPLIRDFGIARNIPTAQTEFIGSTIQDLYQDLTLGGVSYWEHYVLGYYGSNPSGSYFGIEYNLTSFVRYAHYWDFRQIMHYVRPGAVRVETTSSDPGLRPLTFINHGATTIVLLNNTEPYLARTAVVAGLPAGTYGICQTVAGSTYQELGLQTVNAEESLAVSVPADAVLTIYPHPGENQPPTVTDWMATPGYLTMPDSVATLSASATDPELDSILYQWAVTGQPVGASANLANPNTATTDVTDLTVAGEYVFEVTVDDGTTPVTREVLLNVYADNQAPVLEDVHNRNPVLITLPDNSTELRADARDLEGDALTFQWGIVSQPAGANAQLTTPTDSRCPVNALNVPGDYIFEVQASDPTHTVSDTLTVPVYPVNNAPIISAIVSTPPEVVLPAAGEVELSASTSDPDGDVISHFWTLQSAPFGTNPVIASPGSPTTAVTGMTEPGVYVFDLVVVDRTKTANQSIAVVVRTRTGDFDIDTDVDQDDFGFLQACLTGTSVPVTDPLCEPMKLDEDTDIDQDDVVIFRECMSGANVPADPECGL